MACWPATRTQMFVMCVFRINTRLASVPEAEMPLEREFGDVHACVNVCMHVRMFACT
jgi:hypothetical protein